MTRYWLIAFALLACLNRAAEASAQAPDPIDRLIGLPIAAVELQIEGKPDTTPALLSIIEIKPGDRLSPETWRRVSDRFNQIARFEKVTVKVEERPAGLVLIFDLIPRHPIDSIRFDGDLGISGAELERQLREQFNGLPANDRLGDVERAVPRILKNEGFLLAVARAEIVRQHDPDRATLVIHVTAGRRTVIGGWEFKGQSNLDMARVQTRLGLAKGAPYRERELVAGLAAIRDELRAQQFYMATAQHQPPTFSADGTEAFLIITIAAGPLVEVVVDGPLPGNKDDLIPVKQQGSVSTDLLENAQKKIVAEWHKEGYWHASATFEKTPFPDRLVITFKVDRGKPYYIVRLELPAGLHMTVTEMQEQKALRPGEKFDQEGVRSALGIIKAIYQQRGYHTILMDPKFEEVPGRNANEGGVIIRPNITEGPRAVVSRISFDLGDKPVVTESELRSFLLSKEQAPFSLANFVEDTQALPAYYDSRGFLNRTVSITPFASPDGTSVALNVVAREGAQVLVGEIVVVGNERVDTDVILRGLTLKTGLPYSEQGRSASRRALQSQFGFRNVTISPEPRLPGETSTRLIVSIEEADSRIFDVGGGVEAGTHPRSVAGGETEDHLEFAPRASLGFGRRNLNGRNREVQGFARVSFKPKDAPGDPTQDGHGFGFAEYRVAATYRDRYAFQSPTDLLFTISSEQGVRSTFNFIRRIGAVELSHPAGQHLSLLGRYSLEWTRRFDERITDPSGQPTLAIDRLFPQVRLSIFSTALVWDRRDNAAAATRGGQVAANLDVAPTQLGSEVGFVKTFVQGSIFRTVVPNRAVLAGRGMLGIARGFERLVTTLDANGNPVTEISTDLPASHRMFSGGSNSVRGFQVDRLGVQEILDPNSGLSNGGNGLVVFNGELRVQVRKLFKRDLVAVAFVDSGNVFHRVSDIDLSRLRTTVGFGVRYDSPFGPIRMDFGFKTDRKFYPSERRWEFHLSIGEVF